MKKIFITVVFCCIFILTQAQGLYFGGYAGAGTVSKVNQDFDGAEDVSGYRFGKGGIYGLSAGYLFKKNFGTELGLGYLSGSGTSAWTDEGASHLGVGSSKHTMNSFYLNPSFVVRGNGRIVPYGKVGIFIGLLNKGSYTSTYDYSWVASDPTIKNTKDNFTGGYAMGVTAAFGVDFMLSGKFAVFGELFGRQVSWTKNQYTENVAITDQYTFQTIYYNRKEKNAGLGLGAIGISVGVKYYLKK